jgi:hypothetical protein
VLAPIPAHRSSEGTADANQVIDLDPRRSTRDGPLTRCIPAQISGGVGHTRRAIARTVVVPAGRQDGAREIESMSIQLGYPDNWKDFEAVRHVVREAEPRARCAMFARAHLGEWEPSTCWSGL